MKTGNEKNQSVLISIKLYTAKWNETEDVGTTETPMTFYTLYYEPWCV